MKHLDRDQRHFVLFAIGFSALLIIIGILLARPAPTVTGARITTVSLIICGTITMISAFRRVTFAEGRRKKAWSVLSFGAVCGVAANMWSLITDLSPMPNRWYRYGDPLLLAALFFCTAGLVMFAPTRRRRTDLARMVLDGLVIGGSVLFVTSVAIFPQLLAAGADQSLIGRAQNLFLPVMDVLIATLATLLITRSGTSSRVPLVLLGSGFCLYAVSDLSYAVLSAGHTQALGTFGDVGWVAGYLLFALTARHPAAGLNPVDEPQETSPVLSTVVLFMLFFAAAGVSLFQMKTSSLSRGAGIVWILVILAVVGRQILLIIDNERLRRNLERLVQNRTRELSKISKQQEMLLTSVADGIYGVDRFGLITFVNTTTATILGRTEDDLIGRDAHELFHAPRADGLTFPRDGCYVTEAIRSGVTTSAEEDLYVRGNGVLIAVEATASPLSGDDGISGAVVVFRDVSERREVERMKSEFVSIVSHELRTPLTSIRGSLGLVAGGAFGALPPKAGRMLDIALAGTDRLTRLINEILDIERIESGTLPMDIARCDVRSICHEAVRMISGLTASVQVDVVIGRCEGYVRADRDRIVQTLINLLGNAVKFSAPVSQVRLEAVPRGTVIEFSVADQGRGIPADKLDAIFGRFTQVDASDAREKGGTGLGLAISRTIIERLDGRIWAESALGAGSTFRFTLPRELAVSSFDGKSGSPSVVVCGDDPKSVQVLGELLTGRGYRPIGVSSDERAVDVVRREQPATVLVDLQMPGAAGTSVVTALHADRETSSVPIVVVSQMSPSGHPRLAAETNGWVQKPVDEEKLFSAVASAVDHHRSPGAVLVVEDDDALARVVQTLLERHGLTVSRAHGQQQALRMLQTHPPDVLVLDLGLPDGSGLDLVAHLRDGGQLTGLPLVVYSAADVPPAERRRLSLGETVFLTKSRISPEQLERRVVELVDRVAGRHGGGGSVAGPIDDTEVRPDPPELTDPDRLAVTSRPGGGLQSRSYPSTGSSRSETLRPAAARLRCGHRTHDQDQPRQRRGSDAALRIRRCPRLGRCRRLQPDPVELGDPAWKCRGRVHRPGPAQGWLRRCALLRVRLRLGHRSRRRGVVRRRMVAAP